ncbi:family 1 glycosylhydrolase [Candidatus Babeliales bacterium]|nr:family 1 glycosylhydrolase [Candidatus Babeliales bacterium]
MVRNVHFKFLLVLLFVNASLFSQKFSKDFQWGTAIAEFQNSGAATLPDSNWARFQERIGLVSGKSVDHWNKYQEDIELMKEIGINSFRFSIDWSSIEPAQGMINESALQHYDNLCMALLAANITPMATLHHFVHPAWFDDLGGFERVENIQYFVRFAQTVFARFHDKIQLWCTINEPAVYAFAGHLIGIHSPGKIAVKDGFRVCGEVLKNLLIAHIEIYQVLKQMSGGDRAQIGIVHNVLKFQPRYWFEPIEASACAFLTPITNDATMNFLRTGEYLYEPFSTFCCKPLRIVYQDDRAPHSFDFIGLNYYATAVIGFNSDTIFGSAFFPGQIMGDMDLSLDPQGFATAIREVAALGKPIYITENGMADNSKKDDQRRQLLIMTSLEEVEKALQEGIDIRGYYYWTLVDNFEWHKGFDASFGLHDRERNKKPSADLYKNLIAEYSNRAF